MPLSGLWGARADIPNGSDGWIPDPRLLSFAQFIGG